MKKFLMIIISVFVISAVFCVNASADEPASDVVLRLSAVKGDELVVIEDFTSFDDGWNEAMEFALSKKMESYDRVVVDLYANWKANGDGEFTDDMWNGDGFYMDTICVQNDVRLTLNLNGHTINRALTEWEYDGEVLYIDDDADVIINNGTITGGWSCNGAGGINIESGAKVTLNNVDVIGNKTEDDDGAGIAAYTDAVVVMNGGSLSNNIAIVDWGSDSFGGGLYVHGATVTLNDVVISGNEAFYGAAVYVNGSGTAILNNCTVEGNGFHTKTGAVNIFYSTGTLYINGGEIINNGKHTGVLKSEYSSTSLSAPHALFYVCDSLVISGTAEAPVKITGNHTATVFSSRYDNDASCTVSYCDITDNDGIVGVALVSGTGNTGDKNYRFSSCRFNNNNIDGITEYDFSAEEQTEITLSACDIGDSVFVGKAHITIEDSTVSKEDAVIGVSIFRDDGTTASTQYYKDFEFAWNLAMKSAVSNGCDRVVVDLYADWNAVDGVFGYMENGFKWDTVYFPENVCVTLNLNGHTVSRGLNEAVRNGEVMYIEENAEVIINDGTVTGGFSTNGAGGIHIKDGANVTLNGVQISGNRTDGANGAGIAMYDGSVLNVNGGSISNNSVSGSDGAGLYVSGATATLNNVEFKNNQGTANGYEGAAISAGGSSVTVNECIFDGNGVKDEANGYGAAESVIEAYMSAAVTVKKSSFTNNGSLDNSGIGLFGYDISSLFDVSASTLTVEDDCKFTNNTALILLRTFSDASLFISNSTFTDNSASVIYSGGHTEDSYFRNCTFNNNFPSEDTPATKSSFYIDDRNFTFYDCDLGDSTFELTEYVVLEGTKGPRLGASIIAKGSITNILLIASLAAAVASIGLTVALNKKKAAPVTDSESTEDKE